MSNVIERVNRLELYTLLSKCPYMNTYELARELNTSIEDIELYIACLRKMYQYNQVNKYVCYSKDGYFLGDKYQSKEKIFERESKITNFNIIDLKENKDNKYKKVYVSSEENANLADIVNKSLTFDIKRQLDDIDSFKINIVDDEKDLVFSVTIDISQK